MGAFAELPKERQGIMLDNARTIAELRTTLPPFKQGAKKIQRRTLVVNGWDTAAWLRKVGELAAKAIPHSEASTISKSRHFPHMENPSEFNSEVMKFISKA